MTKEELHTNYIKLFKVLTILLTDENLALRYYILFE